MKPGRKPLDATDRSVTLTIRIPGRQFDRLCQDAKREAVSVPELVRRELVRKQKDSFISTR